MASLHKVHVTCLLGMLRGIFLPFEPIKADTALDGKLAHISELLLLVQFSCQIQRIINSCFFCWAEYFDLCDGTISVCQTLVNLLSVVLEVFDKQVVMNARINQIYSLLIAASLTKYVISQIDDVNCHYFRFEMIREDGQLNAATPTFRELDPLRIVLRGFAKGCGVVEELVCQNLIGHNFTQLRSLIKRI